MDFNPDELRKAAVEGAYALVGLGVGGLVAARRRLISEKERHGPDSLEGALIARSLEALRAISSLLRP